MPRQPEVHFRITNNADATEQIIFLDFAYNRNRLRYSTGQTVKVKDWNKNKERVKNKFATTDTGKFLLNDLLDNLQQTCQAQYYKLIQKGVPSPKIMHKALDEFLARNNKKDKDKKQDKTNFFELIERFMAGDIKISSGKKRGRDKGESCLKNYRTTYNRLKEYQAAFKTILTFDSITKEFFLNYVDFLVKKKQLKPNTIAKDIATLKVFMNEAVDQSLTDNLQFKKKSFTYSEEEVDHVYLNQEELQNLYKMDLSSNKRLEQVRDLFIAGAWLGLRFGDFSSITADNIKIIDGEVFIDILTQKTGEQVIIPCHPVVMELFEKYKQNANRLPKKISNQKFNRYIKEVCKLAGMTERGRLTSSPKTMLWEAVSSHTCRRSMITNYYLQGFPTIDLMKISGHRTESNFMKYLRVSKLDTAKRLAAHNKKTGVN